MTRKLKLEIGIVTIVILTAVFAGVFYYYSHPSKSFANPGFFSYSPCYIDGLTSSTSTVKWLTAGKATSTIGHSTLCDVTAGNNTIPKALNLTLQHAASSSPLSVVDIWVQTSMDGKLWSVEPIKTFTSVTATTSREFINPNFYRSYQQVSSTTEALSGSVTATTTVIFQIPNPEKARYFKVFFTTPVGVQPSNVWAELRPVKESN